MGRGQYGSTIGQSTLLRPPGDIVGVALVALAGLWTLWSMRDTTKRK